MIMAGTILGKAAVLEGKDALQSQSYGSSARGGACESNVVISDTEINELSFAGKEFDVMACLSQLALDRYAGKLKTNGILMIDEGFVQDIRAVGKDIKLVRKPFTRIAEKELGNQAVANIIMLGYLINKTELVSRECLKQAVLDTIPGGTEDLNLKALEIGFNL